MATGVALFRWDARARRHSYSFAFGSAKDEDDSSKGAKLDSSCAAKALACAGLLAARGSGRAKESLPRAAEAFCRLHGLVGEVALLATADQPGRADAIAAELQQLPL